MLLYPHHVSFPCGRHEFASLREKKGAQRINEKTKD